MIRRLQQRAARAALVIYVAIVIAVGFVASKPKPPES